MPDGADMPGIIVVLNRSAGGRKLQFESITPGASVAQAGFNTQPLTVVIQGRFRDVSGFLGDLRKLVRVKKRTLAATGRLFAVDSVDFSAPDNKKSFPNVKATLTVDAFTFAGGSSRHRIVHANHVHPWDGCRRSETVMATKVDPAAAKRASRRSSSSSVV